MVEVITAENGQKYEYINSYFGIIVEPLGDEYIKNIKLKLTSAYNKASKEFMMEVMDTAQMLCPVDTGFLKSTGVLYTNYDGSYEIVYDAPYAGYVLNWFDWIYAAFKITEEKYKGNNKLYNIFSKNNKYTTTVVGKRSLKEVFTEAINNIDNQVNEFYNNYKG